MKNASRLLWDYLASFSLHEQEDSPNSNFQRIIDSYSDFEKIINTLIKTVILMANHYTPVAVSLVKSFMKTYNCTATKQR
jgi:hypothetical protein